MGPINGVGRYSFSSRLALSRAPQNSNFSPALIVEPLLENFRGFKDAAQFKNELLSLARDNTPKIFFEGLLVLGRRLESAGRLEAAEKCYEMVRLATGAHLEWSQQDLGKKAEALLNRLRGHGSMGPRVEALLRDFTQHVTDPLGILGMGVASTAFQLTRIATFSRLLASHSANALTRGFGAKALANLFGFLAEVPAFTFATQAAGHALNREQDWSLRQTGRELASGFLLLGAMKLGGWGGTQGGMLGGILLGRFLETRAGLRQPGELSTNLTESLATLLQFNVAGHLAKGIWGKLGTVGRSLIPSERNPPRSNRFLLLPIPRTASGGPDPDLGVPGRPTLYPQKNLFLAPLLSKAKDLHSNSSAVLRGRYQSLFPSPNYQTYIDSIIDLALETPSTQPQFHDRLIRAYANASNAGTMGQALVAEMIEKAFRYDAAGSSTGSFDHSVLQTLIRRLVDLEDPLIRNEILNTVFGMVEAGAHSFELIPVFQKGGFLSDYEVTPEDADLWVKRLNAVPLQNYSPAELEAFERAFRVSKVHPLGKLMLNRMGHILAAKDLPDKLKELSLPWLLRRPSPALDKMLKAGLPPREIAGAINGTEHTAFIEDLRLARKVALVRTEIHQDFRSAGEALEPGQLRLESAIKSFLYSSQALTPHQLVNLLTVNSSTQTRDFLRSWQAGKFRIEVISDEEFDQWVSQWGEVQDCSTGLCIQPATAQQSDILILIRDLPRLDVNTPLGYYQASQELFNRLLTTIHEWEHWRHFSGNYDGIEKGAAPLSFDGNLRSGRLISEIMAHFEELRWRHRNTHPAIPKITEGLGLTPALFYRSFNEWQYFGKENEAASQADKF